MDAEEYIAMASTTWVGTTSDASLNSNWSNGVADDRMVDGGTDVKIGNTAANSLTNFGSMRAFQTLTTTDIFSDAETVTIDSKVYTFQTVLTDVDGHVLIGASTSATLDNLVSAITLGSGSGSTYAASTTAHSTCTGWKPTAATFRAVALDAGTGGNAITVSEACANASWGAGTLANGAATGAVINNIWIDRFIGDINASGSEAQITFNKLYHNGSGTLYLDNQSCNRIIIDSPNYALAASIILTGDVANSIEIVRGRTTINWNGIVSGNPTEVWVADYYGSTENLNITGSGTVALLTVSAGYVTTNGPNVTAYVLGGGEAVHSAGTIGTIDSSGRFQLDSTGTVTAARIQNGILDLNRTTAVKTITTVWKSKNAAFYYEKDRDSITLIRTIGEMGEF